MELSTLDVVVGAFIGILGTSFVGYLGYRIARLRMPYQNTLDEANATKIIQESLDRQAEKQEARDRAFEKRQAEFEALLVSVMGVKIQVEATPVILEELIKKGKVTTTVTYKTVKEKELVM